jgi:PAS domain S-box-containing protein
MPDGGFVTSYTDVTSLKQAQREADTKTALLETTMEAMAQGYAVYDPESRLVAFNKHFENMFKFPEGFLVPNRALEDIIRYRVENDRYEQDDNSHDGLEDEVARRAKNFADRRQQTGERTLLDGKTYVYNRRPMPNGGVVSTYTDITDIKETERALRDTETLLRLVTDASPVLISYVDKDRITKFANKAFAARYGYAPDEIIGKHQDEYWASDQREEILGLVERTLTGEITTSEGRRQHADGTWHDHLTTRAPHFDEDGKVLGYFNVVLDTTEQKRAEAALQQAQKMEAVGQLTGGVAHDFNNLLAVIMGNVELLAEGSDNPASLLESISRSATRGAELTQRLLAFSRLQPLHPQPIDLSDLIDGMMGLLRRSLGETIEICSDVASNLWQAQADPGQVENALLNLALNARDAMPNGGRLTIACANAHLGEEDLGENFEITAGEYIMLTVEDTGTGMPAEVLEHVFEPFYTTKEVGQGSGLGLSMVYGFARQSGGHVAIDSEEGRGTNVKLYLPRAESELAAQVAEQGEDIPTGGGETVLVLEDDAEVRSLVETMIGGLGYQVVTAPTAADAQAALERENIDVVLSDVVLPDGVNGPAFAQQARTLHPDLTVIFMSGYPADGVAANGGIGPDEVLLNKPFKRQILATALHRALSGM